MEFVQFHPTGMVWPPSVKGILVTEGVRGDGGVLGNRRGSRRWYTDKKGARRPPDLLPRDEVARAINAEVKAGRGSPHGGVFLDIASRRNPEYIKRRLPSMYHQFKELADVDITKEPMEVGPTAHYVMGGIRLCMTRLSLFDPAETVNPLRTFPIVRDLVTDVWFNYEMAARVPAFGPEGAGGRRHVPHAAGRHRPRAGVPQVHRVLPVPDDGLPRGSRPRGETTATTRSSGSGARSVGVRRRSRPRTRTSRPGRRSTPRHRPRREAPPTGAPSPEPADRRTGPRTPEPPPEVGSFNGAIAPIKLPTRPWAGGWLIEAGWASQCASG